jgi:hypothetical protein
MAKQSQSKSFVALITPIGGGGTGIWPKPPEGSVLPEHPIVLPPGTALPPGIWPNPPEGSVRPEHPIVLPPETEPVPPGIWPNPPEGTAPIPGHPIVIPPTPPDGPPVTIWPTPPEGSVLPEHPIVIPPGEAPPKNFVVIVYDPASGEWKKMSFVPGGKPPTTPGPKR